MNCFSSVIYCVCVGLFCTRENCMWCLLLVSSLLEKYITRLVLRLPAPYFCGVHKQKQSKSISVTPLRCYKIEYGLPISFFFFKKMIWTIFRVFINHPFGFYGKTSRLLEEHRNKLIYTLERVNNIIHP